MKLTVLENEKINVIKGRKHYSELGIVTKRNGDLYEFDRWIREGVFKQLGNNYGYILRYKKYKEPETQRYFLLLHVQGGLFCTSFLYNGQITTKTIQQFRKLTGNYSIITPEEKFFQEVRPLLETAFQNAKIERVSKIEECMRITLKDPRTEKEYRSFTGEGQNKPYLKPDFKVTDYTPNAKKKERIYFVEVERTRHSEKDFLKKLMKLHMLKHRVYFIFNGQANFDYHAELIAIFEQKTKRKFHSLYYTTFNDLKAFGLAAFQKHI